MSTQPIPPAVFTSQSSQGNDSSGGANIPTVPPPGGNRRTSYANAVAPFLEFQPPPSQSIPENATANAVFPGLTTVAQSQMTLDMAMRDTPAFRASLSGFQSELEGIQRWLEGLVKGGKIYSDELARNNDVVVGMINRMRNRRRISIMDSTVVHTFSEALQTVCALRSKLLETINMEMVNITIKFIRDDIKDMKEFDKIHAKITERYDNALAKYANLPKSKEASALRELINLMGAHGAFFETSSDVFKGIKPSINALKARLEEGRKTLPTVSEIEAKKKALEDEAINRANPTPAISRNGSANDLGPAGSSDPNGLRHIVPAVAAAAAAAAANSHGSSLGVCAKEKEGHLFRRSGSGPKGWTRCYVILQQGQLWIQYLKQNNGSSSSTAVDGMDVAIDSVGGPSSGTGPGNKKNGKVVTLGPVSIVLCGTRIDRNSDRRFCFEIYTPMKSFMMQAETEKEMYEWIACIEESKNEWINVMEGKPLLAPNGGSLQRNLYSGGETTDAEGDGDPRMLKHSATAPPLSGGRLVTTPGAALPEQEDDYDENDDAVLEVAMEEDGAKLGGMKDFYYEDKVTGDVRYPDTTWEKRDRELHNLLKSVPKTDHVIGVFAVALQKELALQGKIFITQNRYNFKTFLKDDTKIYGAMRTCWQNSTKNEKDGRMNTQELFDHILGTYLKLDEKEKAGRGKTPGVDKDESVLQLDDGDPSVTVDSDATKKEGGSGEAGADSDEYALPPSIPVPAGEVPCGCPDAGHLEKQDFSGVFNVPAKKFYDMMFGSGPDNAALYDKYHKARGETNRQVGSWVEPPNEKWIIGGEPAGAIAAREAHWIMPFNNPMGIIKSEGAKGMAKGVQDITATMKSEIEANNARSGKAPPPPAAGGSNATSSADASGVSVSNGDATVSSGGSTSAKEVESILPLGLSHSFWAQWGLVGLLTLSLLLHVIGMFRGSPRPLPHQPGPSSPVILQGGANCKPGISWERELSGLLRGDLHEKAMLAFLTSHFQGPHPSSLKNSTDVTGWSPTRDRSDVEVPTKFYYYHVRAPSSKKRSSRGPEKIPSSHRHVVNHARMAEMQASIHDARDEVRRMMKYLDEAEKSLVWARFWNWLADGAGAGAWSRGFGEMDDEEDVDATKPKGEPNCNYGVAETYGLPITAEEAEAFARLFKIADEDNQGVIPVQKAVPFLMKSSLPQNMLSEIWQQATPDPDGLRPPAFYKIMKLIALCQYQKPVSIQFLASKTPLPVLEGISQATQPVPGPIAAAPLQVQHTGSRSMTPLSAQSTGSSQTSASLSLTQAEVERFSAAFSACNPAGGFVTGDSAKNLFLKSELPAETLGKIWLLVDPNSTLKLNMNQFFAAMYIIMKMKSGVLQVVPTFVPPALWTAISAATNTLPVPGSSAASSTASSPTAPMTRSATTTSPSSSALPAPPSMKISSSADAFRPQQQQSQQSAIPLLPKPPGSSNSPPVDRRKTMMMARAGSGTAATVLGSPARGTPPAIAAPTEWAVKDDEKTLAFQFFDQLDQQKKGFLSGEDSYEFFLKSNLDQTALAKIWDLSNYGKNGRLSKEEFAVAYHLIKSVLAGQALPDTLPPNLIPPSLRPQPPAAAPLPSISTRSGASARSPTAGVVPSFSFEEDDVPLGALAGGSAFKTAAATSPVSLVPQPALAPLAAPQPVAAPQKAPEADPFGLSDAFGDVSSTPIKSPVLAPTGVPPLPKSDLLAPGTKKVPPPVPESKALGDISRRATTMAGLGGSRYGSSGSLLTDDRAADLERAKAQVALLEKELADLTPIQEALTTRRGAYDAELAALNRRKEAVAARFAQIQADYDEEVRILKETEASLAVEQANLRKAMSDLVDAQRQLAEKRERKAQVSEAIESCREMVETNNRELDSLRQAAARYRAELDRMRPEFKAVQAELKRQTNVLNVNKQVLAAAEAEYQQVKQEQLDAIEAEKERRRQAALSPPIPPPSLERKLDKTKSTSTASLRSDGAPAKRGPAPPPPASRTPGSTPLPGAQPSSSASSPTKPPFDSLPRPQAPSSPLDDPFDSSSPVMRPTSPQKKAPAPPPVKVSASAPVAGLDADPFAMPTGPATSQAPAVASSAFDDAFTSIAMASPTRSTAPPAAFDDAAFGDAFKTASIDDAAKVLAAPDAPASSTISSVAGTTEPPPMPPLSTKPSRSNPTLALATPSTGPPPEVSTSPSGGSLPPPPDMPPLSTKPKRPVSTSGAQIMSMVTAVAAEEKRVRAEAEAEAASKVPAPEAGASEPADGTVAEKTDTFSADFSAAFAGDAAAPAPVEPSSEVPAAPSAFDEVDFSAAFATEAIAVPVSAGAETGKAADDRPAPAPFDLEDAFGAIPKTSAPGTGNAFEPFSDDFAAFNVPSAGAASGESNAPAFDFDAAFGGPIASATATSPPTATAGFSFEDAFGGSDPFAAAFPPNPVAANAGVPAAEEAKVAPKESAEATEAVEADATVSATADEVPEPKAAAPPAEDATAVPAEAVPPTEEASVEESPAAPATEDVPGQSGPEDAVVTTEPKTEEDAPAASDVEVAPTETKLDDVKPEAEVEVKAAPEAEKEAKAPEEPHEAATVEQPAEEAKAE
ncbi:hypothetical protein HDU96_009958 [Phlyctochytrium bullatum]|nr:hypothetical protein HDU96_009958 [Phlyctochytrium bullatum]